MEAIANGADDRLWVVFFYSDRSKRDRDAKASVLRLAKQFREKHGTAVAVGAHNARVWPERARASTAASSCPILRPKLAFACLQSGQMAQRRHGPAPGPRKRHLRLGRAARRGGPARYRADDAARAERREGRGRCNKPRNGLRRGALRPMIAFASSSARISPSRLLLHLELVEVRAVDELLAASSPSSRATRARAAPADTAFLL